MKKILINTTKHRQVIDITDKVNEYISKHGIIEGICTVQVAHTTCAITVCDLDPGTDLDMLDAFEHIMPRLKYRHPHDPSHVGDHIWSSIIGASKSLIFQNKTLVLGVWQRIVLVEFSGPRERSIFFKTCS